MKIHSNFIFKRYTFRQMVSLSLVGIISHGKVRLDEKTNSPQEMERYGVLLPNVPYYVASASLEVMFILSN